MKKEDNSVDVENNMLSIYGKFERSFTLPEKVDTENIRAACEDGILEVVIPKLQIEQKSSKKIAIK